MPFGASLAHLDTLGVGGIAGKRPARVMRARSGTRQCVTSREVATTCHPWRPNQANQGRLVTGRRRLARPAETARHHRRQGVAEPRPGPGLGRFCGHHRCLTARYAFVTVQGTRRVGWHWSRAPLAGTPAPGTQTRRNSDTRSSCQTVFRELRSPIISTDLTFRKAFGSSCIRRCALSRPPCATGQPGGWRGPPARAGSQMQPGRVNDVAVTPSCRLPPHQTQTSPHNGTA